MKFLDEAKVFIKAGDGGDGCLSFRRAKFIEFGGPDGGAGGNGGSIYAVATKNINTLIDYRYRQHFKAKKGDNGRGQNKTGKKSDDIILKIPIGTQILDEDKVTEIADLTYEGQSVLLAEGGKGGLGNFYFKTSINQAPRKFTKGNLGEEKWIWLKLKLIADIGLVGLPNAGKTTFLSAVTNAKGRIEDYPFSTLIPQLGIARIDDRELVIADIPGLIENACIGKGLGDKFLAHIERCPVLFHLIDSSSADPISAYITIRNELKTYKKELFQKPELIILNKIDLIDENKTKELQEKFNNIHKKIFLISATMKLGCKDLIINALELFNASDNG
ncbi:MAG: GTPase ObgE [Holosporales bacterium]|jgi:GTP-binding protein|nr:GTPase ObgE [Holosporales bacterium]